MCMSQVMRRTQTHIMPVFPHKYLAMILMTCILVNPGTPASNTSLVEVSATQSSGIVMSEDTYRNDSDSSHRFYPHDRMKYIPERDREQMSRLFVIEAWCFKYYYPFTVLLSGFGSIVTVIVLLKGALRSSASAYILGIASLNLITVLQYCFYTINGSEYFSNTLTWRNIYACYIAYVSFLGNVNALGNAWIVIALAVERLIAVYKPLKAHVICSESRAKKIVCSILLMSILVTIPRCFSMAVRTELDPVTNRTILVAYITEFGATPLYNRIYQTFYSLFGSIIPFLLLGILNVLIIVKLRLRGKQQQILTEGRVGHKGVSQERQIERVLVAIISAFLICTAVAATAHLSLAIHGLSVLYQFHYMVRRLVMHLIYALNPFLNFVLYVCFNQNMRNAVMDLFCLGKFVYKCRNAGEKTSAENNPSASITVT